MANKGKERRGNDGKEGRKKERKRAERKGELMRRKGVERRNKDEIGGKEGGNGGELKVFG